jgi:hypothetical protein
MERWRPRPVNSRTVWMVNAMPTKEAVSSATPAPNATELRQEVAAVGAAGGAVVEDLACEEQRGQLPPDCGGEGGRGGGRPGDDERGGETAILGLCLAPRGGGDMGRRAETQRG